MTLVDVCVIVVVEAVVDVMVTLVDVCVTVVVDSVVEVRVVVGLEVCELVTLVVWLDVTLVVGEDVTVVVWLVVCELVTVVVADVVGVVTSQLWNKPAWYPPIILFSVSFERSQSSASMKKETKQEISPPSPPVGPVHSSIIMFSAAAVLPHEESAPETNDKIESPPSAAHPTSPGVLSPSK